MIRWMLHMAVASALVAATARAQPQDARLASLPRDIAPAETLATRPSGTFLENALLRADGSLLITSYFAREVLAYSSSGGLRPFASIDGHPVSLAPASDGGFVVVVHGVSMREPAELASRQEIFRLSKDGVARKVLTVAGAKFLNGIAPIGRDRYLIADSLAGSIWLYDAATNSASVWLRHEALDSTAPQQMRPGANGVQVSGDTVVISNSTKRHLVAVKLGPDGTPGALTLRAVDIPIDDFAIAADGTIYATTHRDPVVRIRPDGSAAVIAEHAAVKGNAAAFLSADGRSLYVIGDGGLFFGGNEPASLVRLTIGQ